MSTLLRRDGNVYDMTSGDLRPPASGHKVLVLKAGGIVSAASTGSTLTLYPGHGFEVGGKIMLGSDPNTFSGIYTVASTTSTTITMSGGSYNAVVGDRVLNLGPDSGTSTPNYDGSTVQVYSTPDTTTAISNEQATVNTGGDYGYWHNGQNDLWEVILSPTSVVSGINVDVNSRDVGGPTSSTDNALVRWDGTTGRIVQNGVVTASDSGAVTGISTLNTSGATTLGSTLAVTGATTLTGALTANGAVSATAAGTSLAVTNNQTIGGTLTVTGVATLNGLTNTAALTAAGVITANAALQEKATGTMTATSGGTFVRGFAEETVTLSTSGTTTDSVGNLLPANSLILAVTGRVTTTITTATDWSLGVSGSGARFASANSTMTAGSTSVGLNQWQGSVSTDALGPVQAAAAKVRITTTGTPGAGAIKLCVWYIQFTASTS